MKAELSHRTKSEHFSAPLCKGRNSERRQWRMKRGISTAAVREREIAKPKRERLTAKGQTNALMPFVRSTVPYVGGETFLLPSYGFSFGYKRKGVNIAAVTGDERLGVGHLFQVTFVHTYTECYSITSRSLSFRLLPMKGQNHLPPQREARRRFAPQCTSTT